VQKFPSGTPVQALPDPPLQAPQDSADPAAGFLRETFPRGIRPDGGRVFLIPHRNPWRNAIDQHTEKTCITHKIV
jgi:hypothetical protein